MTNLIRECLTCEKSFTPEQAIVFGVSIQFTEQYCSSLCEQRFEQYLKDRVQEAQELGLVNLDGQAIATKAKASEQDINKLIQHFSTRIKKN